VKPECRLWVVRAPARPLEQQLADLTPPERAACARFRQTERQARFACGRALLRRVLAERLGGTPGSIQIAPGHNRRPALTGDSARMAPEIDFNLSSTPGFIACAVASGVRVGVDVELPASRRGRDADLELIEDRVLSPAERQWLTRQESPETGFYRLWTLKEAIAKADGEGLGLPFDRLQILPDGPGSLEADLSALDESRVAWQLFSLDADVPLALALRLAPGTDPELDIAPALPDPTFERVPVRLLARTR
jgi:4'-phosphopantetheinyl transferase